MKFFVFVGAVMLAAGPVKSATFQAVSQVGGIDNCIDSDQNSTGASASCSTASIGESSSSAFSGGGTLGGTALVVIPDASTSGSSIQRLASFGASYQDRLTLSISAGTLVIPFDIAGGMSSNSALNLGTANAVVSTNTQTILNSSSGIGSVGVTDVAFSVSNSFVNLNVSMSGIVSCGGGAMTGGALNTSCSAAANFGNSVRFLGASLFDENGAQVVDFFINSESGFDYVAGATPHDPPQDLTPVPLPAGFLLLLSGVVLLGIQRKIA